MTYKKYLDCWILAGPVQFIKTLIVKIHKVFFYSRPFLGNPRTTYANAVQVVCALRTNGMANARMFLRQLPFQKDFHNQWTQEYLKSFSGNVLLEIFQRIRSMPSPPLISMFTTADASRKAVLRNLLRSLVAQMYENWELCITADTTQMASVRRIVDGIAMGDPRISVSQFHLDLDMAHGPYVVLLDCDVVLEPQALFRIAQCILNEAPDMIYTDEAVFSSTGCEVAHHHYRPAFSLEYLRSHPYIDHMLVARTDVLKQIGGPTASLQFAQRYDLILRLVDAATKIVHIPEALYLWRRSAQQLPPGEAAKAMDESRAALERHLSRRGVDGSVCDGPVFNIFELQYPLEDGQKVAIIIPTKNCGELVRQCIESIARTVKHVPYEIVVIDHASDNPESLSYFEQLSKIHTVLRYAGPFNFSAINNWAISQLDAHADGGYSHYLFCNNDIEAIHSGWLEKMVGLGQMHDVGIVGAKLLYPDRKTIQHAGVCVGMYGIAEHYGKFTDAAAADGSRAPGYHGALVANHEMSAVTAACALMRRDVFEKVGGYDESLAVGFGDVDLCLRVRDTGYRILFCAQAELVHHESYTRGKSTVDPHPVDSAAFVKKWRLALDQCDPYYNPNLTLQSTQWGVRQPMVFQLEIANRIWCTPQAH